MSDETDIGTHLEVPEDQRDGVDPPPEYNADAGFDVQVVPDGEYVELSTADPEEPLASETEDEDLTGDGSPNEFLPPYVRTMPHTMPQKGVD